MNKDLFIKDLRKFYRDGHEVRVAVFDGEPWFVAKDLLPLFRFSSVAYMLKNLSSSDRRVVKFSKKLQQGNAAKITVINEMGIYNILDEMNIDNDSTLPEWVEGIVNEVSPTVTEKSPLPHLEVGTKIPVEKKSAFFCIYDFGRIMKVSVTEESPDLELSKCVNDLKMREEPHFLENKFICKLEQFERLKEVFSLHFSDKCVSRDFMWMERVSFEEVKSFTEGFLCAVEQ